MKSKIDQGGVYEPYIEPNSKTQLLNTIQGILSWLSAGKEIQPIEAYEAQIVALEEKAGPLKKRYSHYSTIGQYCDQIESKIKAIKLLMPQVDHT